MIQNGWSPENRGAVVKNWRCTVPYGCKLEDLLAILHDRAPAKADAVALQRRRVEHGLLSVGLKIHCLRNGRQFLPLVERLGGASKVLEINMYKHSQASLCLVLPPVGNARAAILLLECIERFTEYALFGNRKIQIQVCSPGRLDASLGAPRNRVLPRVGHAPALHLRGP